MPTRGERLRLLGGLLAAPVAESREALGELRDRLPWLEATLAELDATALDEWQAEHTRLFLNGHPRTVCPPFESAWLNGMMLGPSSGAVADLYRRIGVEAERLMPDYLGTMLECAAYLEDPADQAAGALRRELWEQHLDRWLPGFAQALAENSTLALYRELGLALQAISDEYRVVD